MSILKFFLGKDNEKYRYKITVFLICLVISTTVWMLIKLSDQYTTDITIPIVYSEIPEGKILVNKVDTIIKIEITDRGFALAWVKYFKKKIPVSIDLKNIRLRQNMHQYIAIVGTETWSNNFLDQYNLIGKVESIKPDTLAFYFEDRYTKQIPVKSNVTLNFSKQFFAYDSLLLAPDSISVSGLSQSIDKIDFIETVAFTFNDLNKSIDKNIPLQLPVNIPELLIDPPIINLKLTVEKFTESQIEIPISKINQPAEMRIKIFPEKLTVKYLIALKDFKKINPDMFVCNVDLSQVLDGSSNKLDVSLKTFPSYIRILSIEPAEVDFLVLK